VRDLSIHGNHMCERGGQPERGHQSYAIMVSNVGKGATRAQGLNRKKMEGTMRVPPLA
jgi:hypothetical protein